MLTVHRQNPGSDPLSPMAAAPATSPSPIPAPKPAAARMRAPGGSSHISAGSASRTLMAADWRKTPAATSRRPDQNQRRRNITSTDAVSGSIMKISVFEASSRGLPPAVKSP